MSIEQTKGYLRVEGKIFGLNNKEAKEPNKAMRNLQFSVKTSKDNSIRVQVGQWRSSKLNVKIKAEGMEETIEVNEQEAISKIKELFKDGDSVYINCRVESNRFFKSLDPIVSQIYIKKEAIDFESDEFEEVNEINQSIIITEKPSNGIVTGMVVNFNGEGTELELNTTDTDVNDYFIENARVGDLFKVTIYPINKPKYVEGSSDEGGARKTLKGKKIEKSGDRKFDGYENKLEIVDVDIEKTEKAKYDRSDIRAALEEKQYTKSNNTSKKEDIVSVDDGDLPF